MKNNFLSEEVSKMDGEEKEKYAENLRVEARLRKLDSLDKADKADEEAGWGMVESWVRRKKEVGVKLGACSKSESEDRRAIECYDMMSGMFRLLETATKFNQDFVSFLSPKESKQNESDEEMSARQNALRKSGMSLYLKMIDVNFAIMKVKHSGFFEEQVLPRFVMESVESVPGSLVFKKDSVITESWDTFFNVKSKQPWSYQNIKDAIQKVKVQRPGVKVELPKFLASITRVQVEKNVEDMERLVKKLRKALGRRFQNEELAGVDLTGSVLEGVTTDNTMDIDGPEAATILTQQMERTAKNIKYLMEEYVMKVVEETTKTKSDTNRVFSIDNPFILRIHALEGKNTEHIPFNKALKKVLEELGGTSFPFSKIRFELGHTTDVKRGHSLIDTILGLPWHSVYFNVNVMSNAMIQTGYDFNSVTQGLNEILTDHFQKEYREPGDVFVTVGSDGYGIIGDRASMQNMIQNFVGVPLGRTCKS